MKKYIIFIALFLFGVTGYAQNRTASISKGSSFVDLKLTAADTINESETYYAEITCKQNYITLQDVYIDLDSVSGDPGVTVTLYGKLFSGDTYASIGTPVIWYGTADTIFKITNTSANKYRIYKVEFIADGTDQQSLVYDIQFKVWYTSLATTGTSLHLTSTLEVDGETTLNDNLTVTGDADVVGAFTANSMASDGVVSGTGITGSAEANFTNNAAAVTFGAVATDVDVVLAFDAVTAQGSITYMEDEDRFDFDNDVDVIGDLTANTIVSDGSIAGTSISLTANVTQFTVLTTLTATEIIGTDPGDLGHADGAILVAAPAGGTVLQFVSAMLIYDYADAAYTGGGNDLVINIGSTGAQLAVVKTMASSFILGASEDKMYTPYVEYSGQVGLPVLAGEALSLKSTAWTQPGSAAGVLRCYVTYNVITTGL